MIQFILSEYGKHTTFKTVHAGIKHCTKNNLLNGEEGVLWIKGANRKEINDWRIMNSYLIGHEYMHLTYETRAGKKWEWDSVFKKWDTYPELQGVWNDL